VRKPFRHRIPEAPVSAEALRRLQGVAIVEVEGRWCVAVNVDAAEAAAEAQVQLIGREASDRSTSGADVRKTAVMRQAMIRTAIDDPANWMDEKYDETQHPNTRYDLFEINLATGRIEFSNDWTRSP
jgi:hypothetical protein